MEQDSTNPYRKLDSVSTAAIAAAAIAAVTISAEVRERIRRKSGTYLTKRRRNRNCNERACENPGCQCRHSELVHRRQSSHSSSASCSESKPCVSCLGTLAEENTCKTDQDGRDVAREVQQPFRQNSEAQQPPQQCSVHAQHPVSYALHECCCEHQNVISPQVQAPWAIPGSYRLDLPSSKYSSTTGCSIETCCTQLIRHASPISSNLQKQIHQAQVSCCNCNARCSRPHKVRTLKSAKSKSKEQRVQARRIRHPSGDSNSESELEVIDDVRALRPTSSSSPSSSSTSRQRKKRPLCPSKDLPCVSSPPIPAKSAQSSSTQFQHIQTSPRTTSTSADPSENSCGKPVQPPRTAKRLPSFSSSDSSSTSYRPGTVSSTSSSSCSTDLSDSSTSSNNAQPQPNHNSAAPRQRHAVLRNPFHTSYHNPHDLTTSHGSGLPISSGDFWNVSRTWMRNRVSAQCGRRSVGPSYGSRIYRNTGNPIIPGMESTWTAQPTTSASNVYNPRNIRSTRNDT